MANEGSLKLLVGQLRLRLGNMIAEATGQVVDTDATDPDEALIPGVPLVVPSQMNASKARGIVGMIQPLKAKLERMMEDMNEVFEGRYVHSSPELVRLAKTVMDAYNKELRPALLAFQSRAQEMARDRPS